MKYESNIASLLISRQVEILILGEGGFVQVIVLDQGLLCSRCYECVSIFTKVLVTCSSEVSLRPCVKSAGDFEKDMDILELLRVDLAHW